MMTDYPSSAPIQLEHPQYNSAQATQVSVLYACHHDFSSAHCQIYQHRLWMVLTRNWGRMNIYRVSVLLALTPQLV